MASRKKAYAGLMREAWADKERASGIQVYKVKAHQVDQDIAAVEAGAERQDAIGNAEADIAAKQAQKLHPACHRTVTDDIDAQYKRAKLVCRTVVAVLGVLPPMPKERWRRLPPERVGAAIRGRGGHNWRFEFGAWRCTVCLRMTTREHVSAALIDAKCDGPKAALNVDAMQERGHRIAVTQGSCPLIFCMKCGSFSARRARGLAAQCGPPTAAGKQALTYILKGLQPWTGSTGDERLPLGSHTLWDRAANMLDDARDDDADSRGMESAPASPSSSRAAGGEDGHSARGDDEGVHCDGDQEGDREYDVFGHGGSMDEDRGVPLPRRGAKRSGSLVVATAVGSFDAPSDLGLGSTSMGGSSGRGQRALDNQWGVNDVITHGQAGSRQPREGGAAARLMALRERLGAKWRRLEVEDGAKEVVERHGNNNAGEDARAEDPSDQNDQVAPAPPTPRIIDQQWHSREQLRVEEGDLPHRDGAQQAVGCGCAGRLHDSCARRVRRRVGGGQLISQSRAPEEDSVAREPKRRRTGGAALRGPHAPLLKEDADERGSRLSRGQGPRVQHHQDQRPHHVDHQPPFYARPKHDSRQQLIDHLRLQGTYEHHRRSAHDGTQQDRELRTDHRQRRRVRPLAPVGRGDINLESDFAHDRRLGRTVPRSRPELVQQLLRGPPPSPKRQKTHEPSRSQHHPPFRDISCSDLTGDESNACENCQIRPGQR